MTVTEKQFASMEILVRTKKKEEKNRIKQTPLL
jgi:CRISPR/Cas system-associated protein endoribonuclease Cas2